eukprot:TRINITY_DN10880_c0_g2_i1.p1 TRINITY_DN10880_c0_g2~~TRINITY_DN10880_c0_g2_i1.p1  ORF type:complete len:147 (-),score=17.58 TRINITY_DN10880_c0_g2_i1:1272-1712(-)
MATKSEVGAATVASTDSNGTGRTGGQGFRVKELHGERRKPVTSGKGGKTKAEKAEAAQGILLATPPSEIWWWRHHSHAFSCGWVMARESGPREVKTRTATGGRRIRIMPTRRKVCDLAGPVSEGVASLSAESRPDHAAVRKWCFRS